MRVLLFCFLLGCFYLSANAQSPDLAGLMKGMPANYQYQPGDTLLADQLLVQASRCVYKPGELTADLDSAAVMVRHARRVCLALNYTRALQTLRQLDLAVTSESGNFLGLKKFLEDASLHEKIDLLKRVSFGYSTQMKLHGDSALRYAYMVQQLGHDNNLPAVAADAAFYIGLGFYAKGDVPNFKAQYLKLLAFHRENNDLQSERFTWRFLNYYQTSADTLYPTKLESVTQAVAIGRKLGFSPDFVRDLYELGFELYQKGRLNEAEELLLEAKAKYQSIPDLPRQYISDLLGKIYISRGHAGQALHYAYVAMDEVLKTEKDPFQRDVRRVNLAEVLFYFGKEKQAFDALNDLEYDSPPENSNNWFYIATHASILNYRKGPRAAIAYMEDRTAHATNMTVYHKVVSKRCLGQYYMAIGETEKALGFLLEAAGLIPQLITASADMQSQVYILLAQIYMKKKAYDDAESCISRASQAAIPVVPLYRKMHLESMWFQLDSAKGRYVSALRHQLANKILSDSVFNLVKTGQMEELSIRHETVQQKAALDQRAREIVWLTDKVRLEDALLAEARQTAAQRDSIQLQHITAAVIQSKQRGDSLRYANATYRLLNKKWVLQKKLIAETQQARNLIIAGAVLVALLLLLIYNRYRLKQRTNRQMQLQQNEIQSKNDSLEKLVTEKEWLLKEVHHRVKNNLQVVTSLLNIQSHYLHDNAAVLAIQDSQRRVNAISLIHKKLHQSDNAARVDMQHYIQDLVTGLRDYADDHRNIRFVTNIAPLQLDIKKALPIGLILNEAVTNAYKYAFENKGTITITLSEVNEGSLELSIGDDGKGFAVEDLTGRPPSLGMSLIRGLVNDMDGVFHIESNNGTRITVRFPAEGALAKEFVR
ncbi:histidine kinase dimerization/phosphoacceptor domain -containing protein [uncultured Chitinophaga sp.]|uniref:tetratricopeptide repeat-containing sensor histidine kinase n=1 Tax=uncultured Chitinophaga sp. TaxID=339340 RepID=UPI0025FC81D0|nr:histidine kinase dimerization/phosphoacceptor domain -containing protein [uncultured Chitinophaga sp.]